MYVGTYTTKLNKLLPSTIMRKYIPIAIRHSVVQKIAKNVTRRAGRKEVFNNTSENVVRPIFSWLMRTDCEAR